jgi:hypothetical protein
MKKQWKARKQSANGAQEFSRSGRSFAVVAEGSGDGFPAQGAGGECSNSIARLAQNSSPVANATI